MVRNKKRLRAQFEQDINHGDHTGVGPILAHLRDTTSSLSQPTEGNEQGKLQNPEDIGRPITEEWQIVERRSKRRKQGKSNGSGDHQGESGDNRPALTFAPLHKLQSSLRIADLQALVLYCLADGTSPQWISVRHHSQVRKAVVLMVPGLEKSMFDEHIGLEDSTGAVEAKALLNRVGTVSGEADGASTAATLSAEAAAMAAKIEEATSSRQSSAISPDDYLPTGLVASKLPTPLKPLADVFGNLFPIKAPGDDRYFKVHSPLHAMLTGAVPKSHEEKQAGKLKVVKPFVEAKSGQNQPIPISALILSNEDLLDNDYTLHPACCVTQEERDVEIERRQRARTTVQHGWKDTGVANLEEAEVSKSEFENGSLTVGRTVLAMDCEMCRVEGGEMELTRISIIDWSGDVVMDELVKPKKPIIDYLTPFSGITEAKLAPVVTTLSDIQDRLLTLLTPRTIIIGHSLNADLAAIKLTHPFLIDTSVLYPHPRGPPLKSSLKWLAQKYISRVIQAGHGTTGHSSVEDARACLDLVRKKCEKGLKWGTLESPSESIFKRLARAPRYGMAVDAQDGKKGAIVDNGLTERGLGGMASVCIACKSDAEVVAGVNRAVNGDPDGAVVPGGGVDFTWARLRELEALRGWSNDNRRRPGENGEAPITAEADNHQPAVPGITDLTQTLHQTIQDILAIHAVLPPCTLFIVYSGTGDPREIGRLQAIHRQFKLEYATKKWDELSVRWTDTEEQELRRACRRAREGVGFVLVT